MPTRWPDLRAPDGEGTREHLQLWAQMMGKTSLALAAPVNHWWHVAFRLTARGLSTGALPVSDGRRLELELDLLTHRMIARTSDGRIESLPLSPGPVAAFFSRYIELLDLLDVRPDLYPRPVELVEAVPFDHDERERPYNKAWAGAFLQALHDAGHLLEQFRGAFIGKASPVHFFWGGLDLATTRFSGRRAPLHPGGIPHLPDRVPRESYSHECSSAGFWPGGGGYPDAAFYSYAWPEPSTFSDAEVPAGAFYSRELKEFLLPWEQVRRSDDPEGLVRAFLAQTYAAAADGAYWNRAELERQPEEPSWIQPAPTFDDSTGVPLM